MTMVYWGLFVVSLLVLAWQDFRDRAISVWLLVLVFCLAIVIGLETYHPVVLLQQSLVNSLFVVLQLILLSLYFSIRTKRWVYLPDNYLGWGDILFFLPLAVLFSPFYYILFFTTSLILVLVSFLLYPFLFSVQKETVPLAGGQALVLVCWFVLAYCCNWDLLG